MSGEPKLFSEVALKDLIEIVSFIANKNPQAAIKVKEEIISRANILSEHPEIGRLGRVQGTRELVLTGISHILIYRVVNERPQIIRVLHDRQNWLSAPT